MLFQRSKRVRKQNLTKLFPSRADTSITPCIVSPSGWQNQLLPSSEGKLSLSGSHRSCLKMTLKMGTVQRKPLSWHILFLNYHLDNCLGDIWGFHFPSPFKEGNISILQTFTGQGASLHPILAPNPVQKLRALKLLKIIWELKIMWE